MTASAPAWLGDDSEAWDRFWRAGHRACCYQDEEGRYLPPIRAVWQEFFDRLPRDARLVDIGTGNGAVPSEALRWARGQLDARFDVHGVDYADIQPPESAGHERCRVTFHPRTDCRNLPFRDASMDAVTAQFTLEYLPLAEAAAELARVLRDGALLRAVLHVAGGVSERLARQELEEIDAILGRGLFAHVRQVIRHPAEAMRRALPELARDLTRDLPPVATLTPMVLGNLERIHDARDRLGDAAVVAAIDRIEEELRSHHRRLEMLCSGAVGGHRQSIIEATLRQVGFDDLHFTPIRVADTGTLLALQLDARRA